MNTQLVLIVGACSLSLAGGYLIGSANSPQQEKLAIPTERSSPQKRESLSYSSDPASSFARPKTVERKMSAEAKAQSVLNLAKAKMDGSNMMMMDISALADVWNLTEGLNAEELRLALESLDEGASGGRSNAGLRMVLLSQWAERDGFAAAEYALTTQQGGMMRGMSLMGAMSSWAKSDPVSAEAWYEENKSAFSGGRWTSSAIDSLLIRNLAKQDLNAAFSKIDFSKTSERNTAARTMGNLVVDEGMRDQVVAKVQGLEDAGLKHDMLKRMVSSLSYQDVDAAGELLGNLDQSDPAKYAEYQVNYLRGLQYMDPAGALSYATNEIVDEDKRGSAMQSAFAQYAVTDADAAQEWLNTQSPEDKDEYYKRASNQNRRRDFDQSMEWALKIEDDDLRTDQAIDVYKRWTREHKEGAEQWLGSLDQESQEAILDGVAAKD